MFRLFAVFVVAIGLVPLVFGQEINTYNGPIIDMHMHAANIQRDSEGNPRPSFIGCIPGPCVTKVPAGITEEQVLHLTLDAMDRNNIVLGFLSGYDMSPDAITPNSHRVARWLAKAPGRFLPSPFISRPGSPPINRLKAEYSAGKWKGMGEIGTQYAGYPPNDPQLAQYFALAVEFDVPTLIHTLGFGAPIPAFRPSAGNPLLLDEVLAKNPSLRLFVENCGFPIYSRMDRHGLSVSSALLRCFDGHLAHQSKCILCASTDAR